VDRLTAFTGCRPMVTTSIPKRKCRSSTINRSRISLRIKQLLTGNATPRTPQSRLRRLVSNIELLDEQPGGDISVASNSMVFESSLRDDTIWAARNEYRLRYVDGELKMAYKKVILVNNEKALFTLSFLI